MPLVSIRGLKLVTEKAYGSPYAAGRKDQMLNLWALLGGSPLTPLTQEQLDVLAKEAEERKKEEKKVRGAAWARVSKRVKMCPS